MLPAIKSYCQLNYPQMDQDDCVSEAQYLLLCAARSWPMDRDGFWQDYLKALAVHMKRKKRDLSLLVSVRAVSLDARRTDKSGTGSYTLLDVIPAPKG